MRRLLFLLAFLAGPAFAQTFPSQGATPVTDDAEMIGAVAEAELATQLTALRQTSGIDIAVVTLPSMQLYTAGMDADVYARELIADWALGGAEDKGILFLTFKDDRELRIEAGDGVPAETRAALGGIIGEAVVPQFADGKFEAGLIAGAEALIAAATPAAASTTPPAAETAAPDAAPPAEGGASGGALKWIIGLVVVIGGGVYVLNRRAAAKLAATPCENCGKTGLTRSNVVLEPAMLDQEGKGETRLTCPHCGHVKTTPYAIARKQATDKEGKEGKGGGKDGKESPASASGTAKGGKGGKDPGSGASGRW